MPWTEPAGDDTWRVRYRRADGTKGAISGFPDATAVEDHITTMLHEQRTGTWIDPEDGRTTIAQFTPAWLDSLDIDQRTEENYRSFLKVHIRPRWGTTAFAELTNLSIRTWEKKLRASGLAKTTVDSIIKCFSLLLSDAVPEKLIAANSLVARRRRAQRTPRKIWGEPAEVLHVADQAALKYGPCGAVLIVTGGWTGARWGELTGLDRDNVHLYDDDTGSIHLDPDIGALHEHCSGPLYLGPLKTTHNHRQVFVTPNLEWHRRSNFSRRAFRPAADGNLHIPNTAIRLQPAEPGLTFHGLRHSHKAWMIDDGIPEIAQALRLGHVLQDEVQETYSHVAAAVEQRLLDSLQARWDKAVADSKTTAEDAAGRACT